jgi:hypothetical protein
VRGTIAVSAAALPEPAPSPPPADGRFVDSLSLHVAIAGTAVPGANVKELELSFSPYGVQGTIAFWVRADTTEGAALHALLTGRASIDVSIDVAKARYLADKPPPMRIRAVATARAFNEVTAPGMAGQPVLFRRYRFAFADRLRALAAHHRPSVVYANATLESVIAQHLPANTKVTMGWAALRRKRPIVGLGLGDDEAHFYDWLVWWIAAERGHLQYDHHKDEYRLLDDKAAPAGSTSWPLAACGALIVVIPEPARHAMQLLNSWGDATATTAVESPDALTGLRRDALVYTPIAGQVDARKRLETARLAAERPHLDVTCRAIPDVHPVPGDGVALDPDEFSAHVFGFGETFRTSAVRLAATATRAEPEDDVDLEETEYRIALAYEFEAAADPTPRLPPFRAPRYPMFVEGRIVSTIGEIGDRTYTVFEDEATSCDHYGVRLPLWNVEIKVPFTPQFEPGHLYFPAYRESRVLLAVHFDAAEIVRFLDWGKGVRPPAPSQGNHILFGKNAGSETGLKHWYVDSKPELEIRRTHAGDIGIMTVRDGTIVFETFDDEALVAADTGVSLQPDAAIAAAQVETRGEAAMAEVQGASDAALADLRGNVDTAASATQSDTAAMQASVRQKIDAADADVGALGTTPVDLGKARLEETLAGARTQLRAIFEDG